MSILRQAYTINKFFEEYSRIYCSILEKQDEKFTIFNAGFDASTIIALAPTSNIKTLINSNSPLTLRRVINLAYVCFSDLSHCSSFRRSPSLRHSDRSWLRVALHQYTGGLRCTFFFLGIVASQILQSIFRREAEGNQSVVTQPYDVMVPLVSAIHYPSANTGNVNKLLTLLPLSLIKVGFRPSFSSIRSCIPTARHEVLPWGGFQVRLLLSLDSNGLGQPPLRLQNGGFCRLSEGGFEILTWRSCAVCHASPTD